jgi:hypothetical protein
MGSNKTKTGTYRDSKGRTVIVGGGRYTPGGTGRNASTGDFKKREQTIPRVKKSQKAQTGAEASQRAQARRESSNIPKVQQKAQRVNSQAINEINAYRDSLKKNTKAITPEEAIKRNNYRRYQGQSISNSKPMSQADKELTNQLKSAFEANRVKENARKAYGTLESALAGAGQALTAPASGVSKIIDKVAGRDVFKDDNITRNAENRAALARQAHGGAYGAGTLAGMMLGSYALGGGSVGTGGANAAEAYNTAKEASMAMNGLSKQQAAIQGLKSAAKTLGLNTVKELPKDLVMDTLPRVAEVIDDPTMSNSDRAKAIAENVMVNALMNNISEIPGLVGVGKDFSRTIKDIPTNQADNVIPRLNAVDMKANRFNGEPTVISSLENQARRFDGQPTIISQLGDSAPVKNIEAPVRNNLSGEYDISSVHLKNGDERFVVHDAITHEPVFPGKSFKTKDEAINAYKSAANTVETPEAEIPKVEVAETPRVETPVKKELSGNYNIQPVHMNDGSERYVVQEVVPGRYGEHYEPVFPGKTFKTREEAISAYQSASKNIEAPVNGYNSARQELDNLFNEYTDVAKAGGVTDSDWRDILNSTSEIAAKYGDDPDYQNITELASQKLSDFNAMVKAYKNAPKVEAPRVDNALKNVDNGYEWVDPDRGVSVKEILDTLRSDLNNVPQEIHPTTRKNVDYLKGSIDRLETAYRTGENFSEAYEDYRKAFNRVNDNMAKKEGNISWKLNNRTLLNLDNPDNIANRFKRLSSADNFDDAELPFNDDFIMPEDTGLRRGYNIQDDNIRIDASTAESANAGDRVIPEMEIERLTEQPDTLTTTMRERNYHASSAERGAIPEEIKQALREQDSIDRNTYAQVHNWQTEDKAIELWDNVSTFDEAEEQLQRLMRDYDPAAVPFARRLVSAYSKDGNTAAAMKVMDDVSESLTKAGRFTQSAVLGLAKDDPLTALRYAEKEINKINEAGSKKFGKKWKDFVLSDDEKALFNNIQPGDEAGIQDAFETIGKRIEREYPVTLREQLKEATHIGMLLNPRTMSRNVIANIPTLGMRAAGNRVEAIGQRIAHLANKDIEVNQSLLGGGKKSRALAKEVYNKPEIKALFDALDGKYNEVNNISKHIRSKQMFKGNNPVDNFIDGMLGGYWSENGGLISKANKALGAEGNKSAMEALRGSTYKLLELGDAPFVKENFVARLASEIKTKGWKSADEITDDAIQRALKESLEATYKDPNRLSKLLLDFKKNTGLIGEGAVPFAQTLGSIGMRSYEYSPAGALVSLGKIASAATNGNNDAVAEGIRQLSKGVTGTGMILAGMALYKSGLITGDYSDDPTIKEAQKRDGFKPYAIHIGDKYYTFDWMQPASVSGIIGIALAQAVENQESVAEGLKSGALAAGDAWFNQSAFQSLAELLGGGNDSRYGENSITQNFVDMILEMPQRLVPTSVGATARTLDRSYRDIYDQTSYLNNYKNQVMAKIPKVSEMLPQSYDAWGQPRMRADSLGEAAFQQYINPGEYSEENLNELDSQIKAIYDEYPDKRLYPDKIPYTITSGDFNMKLNNEQHSELSRVQGGYNSELATAMLGSDEFNSLPNESKAEVADQVYSVARDLALSQLYGKEPIGKNEKAIAALRSGGTQELISYLYRTEELGNLGVSNTEKMQNLIKEGGTEAVQQYLDIQERAPKTEKGNVSKAGLMNELAKLPKDQQELMYNAFDTNPSKEESEAYAKAGASAAIEAFQKKQKENDKKAREKAKKQNQIAREAGVSADNVGDLQKELASYGAIDSETTVKYYGHAKQTIPSLTPKQYVNNLHKIGGDDYKIQRPEMLSYFDKTNPSQEEAMKYWNAYGDWSTIPYLKKDGTWGAKKR